MNEINREEIYLAWAPESSPWSPWVKPVLFAQFIPGQKLLGFQLPDLSSSWVPPLHPKTALVLDLPGVESVSAGLVVARAGYRPIPLFNCCRGGLFDVVPVDGLFHGLVGATDELVRLRLPPTTPPAFLLDSTRMTGKGVATPGMFDNRWIVLPQDFPSARFLQAQGIEQALLIQHLPAVPKEDLAHVLLRWKEGGIRLQVLTLPPGPPAAELSVSRPRWYKSFFYYLLALAGLRENSAGGFGSIIPEPSQSHGGFA